MSRVHEGEAPFREWRTWYRVMADLRSGRPPLVVLHGGPGCTHEYADPLKDIAASGRAVVHYDQLGNGRSTHLPGRGADFWTVQLFLDELDNLLEHLEIAGSYHVFGQSWGGMLGSEHAIRRPPGLRSIVIANSPPSMELWVEEANRLREELPPGIQATLLAHEAAGTTLSPAYAEAMKGFYERHVCRIVPMPAEAVHTFKAIEDDPTVYFTMNGPSEFHVTGTLKTWSVIDRLHRIDVPVLLISGRYDEATPKVVQPFADNIKDVRWTIFEQSSHMPHVEEREACMKLVDAFLDEQDAKIEGEHLHVA
jgi:L-proline amide hydrolase